MAPSSDSSLAPNARHSTNPEAFSNIVREPTTCRVCATPVRGYEFCWRCGEHGVSPALRFCRETLDIVPIRLEGKFTQMSLAHRTLELALRRLRCPSHP
jgi:hypothetical protein